MRDQAPLSEESLPHFILRDATYRLGRKGSLLGSDNDRLGSFTRSAMSESAYPPIAAQQRTSLQVALGQKAAVSNRSTAAPYSITSSARASRFGGISNPISFAVARLMTDQTCLPVRPAGRRLLALENAANIAGGAAIGVLVWLRSLSSRRPHANAPLIAGRQPWRAARRRSDGGG